MSDDNGHHGEKVIEEIRSLVIPPGWARASVGEVGDVRLGRQRSPKNRSAEFPTKYVRAANITWNGLDLSDVLDMDFRPSELASYRLQPGDVLLAACLMCDDVLLWIIRTARATAGQYNISVGNSRLLPLPLPPAKEQAAIVEILDESLSQIAAAETIIEHGLFRASRLRQSILKQGAIHFPVSIDLYWKNRSRLRRSPANWFL
jgi:type I restriction enzyme S subunit